jgi:hypothetical protein
MITESLANLVAKIERRRKHLERLSAHPDAWWKALGDRLRKLWSFIQAEPLLKNVLDRLQQEHNEQDCDATALDSPGSFSFSQTRSSDAEQAAFASFVLSRCCSRPQTNYQPIKNLGNSILDELIAPLCEYLVEQIDDQQMVTGHLLAYKKRCEWFDRETLLAMTAKAKGTKINEVEKRLQVDLYRYLHDRGINFYITPYSVRGEIDLIADQREGRKLYVEVKVFDGEGRNKTHIKQGFNQAFTYAKDYGTTEAYLLIYRTCERPLVFSECEQMGFYNYVRVGNVVVYLLEVALHVYDKPVNARGSLTPITITKNEFAQGLGI